MKKLVGILIVVVTAAAYGQTPMLHNGVTVLPGKIAIYNGKAVGYVPFNGADPIKLLDVVPDGWCRKWHNGQWRDEMKIGKAGEKDRKSFATSMLGNRWYGLVDTGFLPHETMIRPPTYYVHGAVRITTAPR